MINREWQEVTVISYDSSQDAYGQKRQGSKTTRVAEMVCKIYSQNSVEDVRYTDVTHVGLTRDKAITDANQIKIGSDTYNVLYVFPTAKLNQVLMRKVQ